MPARTGYEAAEFAEAHRHEGTPVALVRSGGWLIRRPIAGAPGLADAIGCYPLMSCADWSALPADLAGLADVVAVMAVIDPLADAGDDTLRGAFPDVLRAYKQHHVVELDGYDARAPSKHHRRNVVIGRRECTVTIVEPPVAGADEWVQLYGALARRHVLDGRADLPARALRRQLEVPGAVLLRAAVGEALAGMVLWMRTGRRVYYHLGAYNETGYRTRAAYALFDASFGLFTGVATHAVLGAGAGIHAAAHDDGLVRFKRGWGTVERPSRLGGRVVDGPTYERLAARAGTTSFFPAYRDPGCGLHAG